MSVALLNLRLVALRRATGLAAASGITVAIGSWLVLKSHYYGMPLAALPLAVAVPAWLAITRRTSLALSIVLVYLGVLDGVIKLKSGGHAATLGRDVLLYAVAIGMVMRARGPFRLPPLGGWVIAWIVVVLVQISNPGNLSMSHAVASVRQDLEFVPLFFIGYAALRTHASLHVFFGLLLAVAAINAPVAAYQSTLTPQQLSAWGPGYRALISGHQQSTRTFADAAGQTRVRPPGLGSDEGFGGALGAIALPGGIALLITYQRRRRLLALIVVGMFAAVVGVLTAAQRTHLLTAILVLFATLGLLAVGRQGKRALIAVCLVAAVAVTAVSASGSYNSATFDRFASIAPGSAASTIYSRHATWSYIPRYMREIPFGAGLGKVGPASMSAGGVPNDNWNGESESNLLIVETGIPGLFVFLAFQAALCSAILKGLRREHDQHTVVLMAGLAAPLFGFTANWFVGTSTVSTPSAPYLWLAAGVISWWLVTRQRPAVAAFEAHG